jgi:hydrogenase maturation protease
MHVKLLIACLGNPLMGDDGVGILAANELAKLGCEVVVCGSDLSPILARSEEIDVLVIVDAVDWGAKPGSILTAKLEDLEEDRVRTSHSLRVSEVVRLMKYVFGRPSKVYVVGVQPERVEPSTELSPSVRQALGDVIERVRKLVMKLKGARANA